MWCLGDCRWQIAEQNLYRLQKANRHILHIQTEDQTNGGIVAVDVRARSEYYYGSRTLRHV